MKGQLTSQEVKSLLWQLLQALKYLHSIGVWHRDIKTSNIFISYQDGVRVLKLGDFGSARSAEDLNHADNEYMLHTTASYEEMEKAMSVSDLYVHHADTGQDDLSIKGSKSDKPCSLNIRRGPPDEEMPMDTGVDFERYRQGHVFDIGKDSVQRSSGLKPPLTRVVMTPMYRAPEVVMSLGKYNAAIDMWGVGCVFAELLHRVAYVGSASTPNLQVAPLFALRGRPPVPEDLDSFGSPDAPGTQRELKALFKIIGTPAWCDIQKIEQEEWREYLAEHVHARAPVLYRQFKHSGEIAVHLLSRLLEFSPERRASSEEALNHEFFDEIWKNIDEAVTSFAEINDQYDQEKRLSYGSENKNTNKLKASYKEDELMDDVISPRSFVDIDVAAAAASHSIMVAPSLPTDARGIIDSQPKSLRKSLSTYWVEDNPSKALALLENELGEAATEAEMSKTFEGSQRLRSLLETECSAVAEASATDTALKESIGKMQRNYVDFYRKSKDKANIIAGLGPSKAGTVGDVLLRHGPGLQEDTAHAASGNDFGMQRLANVADTWQGRELDPRKFLGPKRHGEWIEHRGGGYPDPGPRWGVTAIPPGIKPDDTRLHAAVKKQQER